MEERNAESAIAVPNAILDTNVVLAIYSWHDVTDTARIVLERDPSASLEHAEIQFRAQRARAAFLLTLFFNERGWEPTVTERMGPVEALSREIENFEANKDSGWKASAAGQTYFADCTRRRALAVQEVGREFKRLLAEFVMRLEQIAAKPPTAMPA